MGHPGRCLGLLVLCLRTAPSRSTFASSALPSHRRRRTTVARSCSARPFDTAFTLSLQHGVCLAVRLPSSAGDSPDSIPIDELHPRERDVLAAMRPERQLTYAGGRLAMRRALREVGASAAASAPILSDVAGAPAVLPDALGSISHTRGLAIAFVRPARGLGRGGGDTHTHARGDERAGPEWHRLYRTVGIDVESASRSVALRVSQRVLAPEERATLGALPCLPVATDLLLRISIKEALYKALHPLVRGSIRWHSVQVQPAEDGTCTIDLVALEEHVGARMAAEANWRLHEGFFISTAVAAQELSERSLSERSLSERPLSERPTDGVVLPTAGKGASAVRPGEGHAAASRSDVSDSTRAAH